MPTELPIFRPFWTIIALLGLSVNSKDSTELDRTPLHLAAIEGQVAVAKLLIDRGSDVAALDRLQLTPLQIAARSGHVAVAQLLLDRGSDVEPRDASQSTPLHNAAMYGRVAVAQLLLDRVSFRFQKVSFRLIF